MGNLPQINAKLKHYLFCSGAGLALEDNNSSGIKLRGWLLFKVDFKG